MWFPPRPLNPTFADQAAQLVPFIPAAGQKSTSGTATVGATLVPILTSGSIFYTTLPDGSVPLLKITAGINQISGTVDNDLFTISIERDSTRIAQRAFRCKWLTDALITNCEITIYDLFSEGLSFGLHTYSVNIQRFSGTGVGTASASATAPNTLLVEQIF